MSDCDDSNVDCSRPGCRNKCGWLQWFGNLSNCTVVLQYQNEEGGLWHSLGEYGPNQHTELGGGIVLLPQEVNVRVIEKPDPSSTGPPKEIANYGRLGSSLPSLYVTANQCFSGKASAQAPQATQFSQPSQASQIAQSQPVKISWFWWAFISVLVGLTLALSVWAFIKTYPLSKK